MPTPSKGPRLGGSPAHQRAILANLATSLFEHGAITTTEAKARRLRPFAERLISKAKRGDLHNRRQVLAVIRDKSVVHVLFTEIGPRYVERPGGYTRITKIGPRKGDNAPMAVIELVQEESKSRSRGRAGVDGTRSTPGRPAKKAATPVVDDSVEPAEATVDTDAVLADDAGLEDGPVTEAAEPAPEPAEDATADADVEEQVEQDAEADTEAAAEVDGESAESGGEEPKP